MSVNTNVLHYNCRHCGNKLQAAWKPRFLLIKGHWLAEECPACHKKTDLSSIDVIPCPHCQHIVPKNEKFCASCGQPVDIATERFPIPCSNPNCDFTIYLPRNHKGTYSCTLCGTVLTQDYIRAILHAKLIELPAAHAMEEKDLVVYKHPLRQFAYKSRLQVSEGTYALLLQDGVCQYPLGPGNYLLEGSDVKAVDRFDDALEQDGVVFNRDIYCVVKNLPALGWGGTAKYIEKREGGAPDIEYDISSGSANIRLQVDDPKLFVTQIGFAEITSEKLYDAGFAGDSSGWLKEKTVGIISSVFGSVCHSVFGGHFDQRRWKEYTHQINEQLKAEIAPKFREYGLSVLSVSCGNATLTETEDSKKAYAKYLERQEPLEKLQNALRIAVESEFDWSAENVTLHCKDHLELKASADFAGKCRLKIQDTAVFFDLPEVKTFLANEAYNDAKVFFQAKVHDLIRTRLAHLAQRYIDQERIRDLLDAHAYDVLTMPVSGELDDYLGGNGLKIAQMTISLPEQINASEALKKHCAIDWKKERILEYAQKSMDLQTAPILVHTKEDATVYVRAVFSCHLNLRVEDEAKFFSTPDVKSFLNTDPFVSAEAVSKYYAKEITPRFSDIISRIVQAIVIQTNADIRELNRLNGILHDNVINNMLNRVEAFGMTISSMDMLEPQVKEESDNLRTWIEQHELRSSDELEREIEKIKNDRTIFTCLEGNRVEVSIARSDNEAKKQLVVIDIDNMELDDSLAQKKDELRRRAAEREFQEEIEKIRREDNLEKLLDDIASARDERAFNKLHEEYKRKYILQEEEINQAIRVARIKQQGEIDAIDLADQAKFKREINAAEHKRILGDIQRKLEESDLNWRKVLDEYTRTLRRQGAEDQRANDLLDAKTRAEIEALDAKTSAETDLLLATTREKIRREENETYLLIGSAKIKLNSEEAELMERIAAYNENRQKRIEDDMADRQERKAAMDFDRRMRERQTDIAYEIQKLQIEHAHEEAIRTKDDELKKAEFELQKYQYLLNYMTHEATKKAEIEKARFDSEAAIKKAEAEFNAQHANAQLEAEQKRIQQEIERADEIAKRAEEQQKRLIDTLIAQEKLRLEFAEHKDDNATAVAKILAEHGSNQQSDEYKRAIEKLIEKSDDNLKKLHADLGKLMSSQQAARDKIESRIKELKKLIYAPVNIGPYYPPHGGQPGGYAPIYNQTPVVDPLAPELNMQSAHNVVSVPNSLDGFSNQGKNQPF